MLQAFGHGTGPGGPEGRAEQGLPGAGTRAGRGALPADSPRGDGLLTLGSQLKVLPGLCSSAVFQSPCRTASIFHIKNKSKEIFH